MKEQDKKYLSGLGLSFFTGVMWSTIALSQKFTLQFADGITISWFRFLFSTLVLFLYFLILDRKNLTNIKKLPWLVVPAGILLSINYVGFILGVKYTSASNATIMIQLGPILLAFAGILILKEKITHIQKIGLATLVFGFSLFLFDQISTSGNIQDFSLGTFWVILGAITWAGWGILNKKIIEKGFEPQLINMIVYGLSAVILTPMSHITKLAELNNTQWYFLSYTGLNTLLAYGAFALSMKLAPVNKVSVIISVYPLLTLALIKFLDVLQISPLVHEPLSLIGLFGALLIVSGVVLSIQKR